MDTHILPLTQGGISSLEGFGSTTTAGSGGEICVVTNLNDSGDGSLRDALSLDGCREIRFGVEGTINLLSAICITNPYFTILGNTAPGLGITIKGHGLFVNTHDFIIKHLRVRPGVTTNPSEDAITLYEAYNGVVDHCSLSWASDEIISVTENSHDITISWCIVSEGLMYHSAGSLIKYNTRRISLHHCLYAFNNDRNPQWSSEGATEDTNYDMRNNVIALWGNTPTQFFDASKLNMVGNYYKRIDPTGGAFAVRMRYEDGRSLFLEGNLHTIYCRDGTGTQFTKEGVFTAFISRYLGYDGEPIEILERPLAHAEVRTTTALQAYVEVMAFSGAHPRDTIDARVIQQVHDGVGSLIKCPNEVGG